MSQIKQINTDFLFDRLKKIALKSVIICFIRAIRG